MTIEVQAPDGSIVEFPEGTAPDVMKGAMQKRFGGPAGASAAAPVEPTAPAVAAPPAPPAPAAKQPISRVGAQNWDLGSEILNGMTFGALPNAQAGVLAGVHGLKRAIGMGDDVSVGDKYSTELKAAQDARREYRGEYPLTSVAGEVGGGLVTGTGLAKSGVTMVGRIADKGLKNLHGRMALGAAEGTTYGAAAGFGGSEGDVGERLQSAKENIPLGAVGGGLAPALMSYVVKPVAGVVSRIRKGLRDPEGHANDLLVNSIMRDKQSPEQLAQAVETAGAAGQPDFRAVDAAGRNTQKLAKMAGRTPGEFRNDAAQILDARQGGQVDRIKGYIDDATGSTGPNAREVERGITEGRATAAKPLYETAYKAPAPSGEFYDGMLQRQSVKDALVGVERMAGEKQMPLTDLFTTVAGPNGDVRVPTMRGWDMVKRNLDAQVDAGFRSPDGQVKAAAGSIKETRDALRAKLGEDNPDYKAALARYTDDSSSLEAVQAGRDLARTPTDATREAFDLVPEGRKDLARIGGSAEIRNKLDTQRSGQDATLGLDRGSTRDVLDKLAVDPTARAALGNAGTQSTRSGQIGREQDMAATRRLFAGGSDTVENLLEQTPPGALQGLALMFSGHPIRGAGAIGEVLQRAASGLNEAGAKTVGDLLMSNDPNKVRAVTSLFNEAQRAAGQPDISPAVLSAALNAPRQRPHERSELFRR